MLANLPIFLILVMQFHFFENLVYLSFSLFNVYLLLFLDSRSCVNVRIREVQVLTVDISWVLIHIIVPKLLRALKSVLIDGLKLVKQ